MNPSNIEDTTPTENLQVRKKQLGAALEEVHEKLNEKFTTRKHAALLLRELERWRYSESAAEKLAEDMSQADGNTILDRWKVITGYPRAEIEDIVRISEPPYFAACPNPFLSEVIDSWRENEKLGSDAVADRPFEGELKSHGRPPVYTFHPYHTKAPPDVIRRLIEHYSAPGEIVLDGFCGSGMAGVAARDTGRRCVLADLSPAAGFISAVSLSDADRAKAADLLLDIAEQSEKRFAWFYETEQAGARIPVNHFIWTDVFTCPECGAEFPFFPHGVEHKKDRVKTLETFPCPECGAALGVRTIKRVVRGGDKEKRIAWVDAGSGVTRFGREPEKYDFDLADEIERLDTDAWFPTDAIDPKGLSAYLAQLEDKKITDVTRLLSRRNMLVFADLWARVMALENGVLRNQCLAVLTSSFNVISERQGYFGGGGGMSGTMYMPIVRMEKNVYKVMRRRIKKLRTLPPGQRGSHVISTQSSAALAGVPDASIDYIFTDPPFGSNIIYSEMNLLMESWLKVKMNAAPETVIDKTRKRKFNEYAALMKKSFEEFYRVLKPGRWITVEFHNTNARVWNLVQESIGGSGFVIEHTGAFDKGSTTLLSDIRCYSVKRDLLISARKPEDGPAEFEMQKSNIEEIWSFVSAHLEQLPVPPEKKNEYGEIEGRRNFLIYNRMLAHCIEQGLPVPCSARTFYKKLTEKFRVEDGLYF